MAGYRQGIGTGLTRRKQSATTKDIFSKIIKYGKGDSRLVVKYPNKSLNILFHQLIRYPIIRVIQIALQGKIIYIPFFVLMGFGRFFSMVIELPKSYLMSK